MWCGDCGQELVPIHDTATVAHVNCPSRAYWLEQRPLPKDNVVGVSSMERKGRWFWLYRWIPGGPP